MRKYSPSSLTGPEIVAHRGDVEHFPENTLPACASALDFGLTHVEIDVQLSQDLVPWVIHDARLERTTRSTGDLLAMTAAELAAVDAGEPQRFGDRHAHTALPRLADFVALLLKYPRARAFIEIKRASLFRHGHAACLRPILEVLQPAHEQCIAISFDAHACRLVRELSALPIGWVFDGDLASHLPQAEILQPEYLFCDQRALLPGELLPTGPWRWAVYEVTRASEARSLHARGATLVESMAPQRLATELAAEAAAE